MRKRGDDGKRRHVSLGQCSRATETSGRPLSLDMRAALFAVYARGFRRRTLGVPTWTPSKGRQVKSRKRLPRSEVPSDRPIHRGNLNPEALTGHNHIDARKTSKEVPRLGVLQEL